MQVDQKQPLRISVHGLTEKMRNTLEYFFHGPCNDYCEMVDEGSSDLSIIDLDGLTGQKSLEKHRVENPEKPLILLSVNNREIDDAILVRKPLKPENLISAVEAAHQRACRKIKPSDSPANKSPKIKPSEKVVSISEKKESKTKTRTTEKAVMLNKSAPVKVLKPKVSAENNVEKAAVASTRVYQTARLRKSHDDHSYISSVPDIDLNDSSQLANAQYNPEIYFQGYITQAINKAGTNSQAVLLTIPDGWIVIQPDTKSVFINIQETRLRAFCALPITDQTITQSLLEKNNLSDYIHQATFISLEQLLWKSAIWSSRGRVPLGTSLTLPISLRHWPNLSRLLLSPHALRISALWSEYPCSLLETAKRLQIPQRYVFAFYSACDAIGVASVEPDSTEAVSKIMPDKRNHKRAFLGRLLERLKVYTK